MSGWRTGIVVAASVPLVLVLVATVMLVMGGNLDRISLSALIITLSLLEDDANITAEMMVVKLGQDWDRVPRATFAYCSTAFPMLTGKRHARILLEAAQADDLIHAELELGASPLPRCCRFARATGERSARSRLPQLLASLQRAGFVNPNLHRKPAKNRDSAFHVVGNVEPFGGRAESNQTDWQDEAPWADAVPRRLRSSASAVC